MLMRRVTCPHEIGNLLPIRIYMFWALFVQGYMIIGMGEERAIKERMATNLEDLMSDAELYGWEGTRAFHTVWLNQLEQGRNTWHDKEKLIFRWALVWHPAPLSPSTIFTPRPSGSRRQHNPPRQVQCPSQAW